MNFPDSHLPDFLVEGRGSKRRVKCGYCGSWSNVSILPHLKREHPELWESWRDNFVELWNQGLTSKQIMRKFNTLFTWAIIEKEIQKIAERNPDRVGVHPKKSISEWRPSDFELEKSTVWSFRKRGDWAVHTSDYRGNWAPQVPRNLILQYTNTGEAVLDPFVGGGTTLIECNLEGRNGIGIDINPVAIKMTNFRIEELRKASQENPDFDLPEVNIQVRQGDARDLDFIEDKTIDLICAHPPYANTLRYTFYEEKDLSQIEDIDQFCTEMGNIARELNRVLADDGKCAVLIGDIRINGEFIPLEHRILEDFKKAHFKIWERIIKIQYHDKSTAFYLNLGKSNRHWIAHEHLLIFTKI